MARFIVARIFSSILLFFAVTLFVFIVFFVMPQPQIRQLGRGGNASDYDIHNALRLQGTLPDQYVHFTWGLVRHGELGRSYKDRREVKDLIFNAAPVTLSLLAGGVVFWLLLAVPVSIPSGPPPRAPFCRAGVVFLVVGLSAHPP